MAILEVKNLTFQYPNVEEKALDNLSFQIEEGEFIIIAGNTGCGKTTLLKMLKKELTPYGKKEGTIFYNEKNIESYDKDIAFAIGYIMQNPESQIITDKVWHELAFPLENQGLPHSVIKQRIAEVAGYFNLEKMMTSDTAMLSGGEKQIVSLASGIASLPRVLLLDEPTSQLDPEAAIRFIELLVRINHELGITIVIAEHNLETIYQYATKLMIMEKGKISLFSDIDNITKHVEQNPSYYELLPTPLQILSSLDGNTSSKVNISTTRKYLENYKNDMQMKKEDFTEQEDTKQIALEVKSLYFRYDKKGHDILCNTTFPIYHNQINAIIGGNGAGKTTLLKIIAGILKPYLGKIKSDCKKIVYLPQYPQIIFHEKTIYDDLYYHLKIQGITKEQFEVKLTSLIEKLNLPTITEMKKRSPYDLSGGQMQKVALTKLLLLDPEIIILDEATKGLDANSKKQMFTILTELKNQGLTIIIATHDIEYIARYADNVMHLFGGEIISSDEPHTFFTNNILYTTLAKKIATGYYDYCITAQEIIRMAKLNGKK